MSKSSPPQFIRLRGVRHNNLKNFDLDLPLHRLIVVTGLSGSGKSSLAFDTLFAEGQRRYIETFSPYARQFLDRMDKPQVDSIEGIPPAIAIEQRNSVKTTRSTVGTMTEICDYMKLLWPQVARLHCRQCGQPVTKESPQQIWEAIAGNTSAAGAPPHPALSPIGGEGGRRPGEGERLQDSNSVSPLPHRGRGKGEGAMPRQTQQPPEFLITFSVPISEKLSLDESLALIAKQGYQRLLVNGEPTRLDDAIPALRELKPAAVTIVQDRLKPASANRARFIEACEQAYHFGKGKLALFDAGNKPHFFSNRLHCAQCDIEYREPSPALFSFNHPVGACPTCRGFGRTITIDYDLALPDRSKTIAEGVVKPWQTGQSAECQDDMMKFCKIRKVPIDFPFRDLSQKWQDWVLNGDPDYGKDKQHEWPKAWYGIKGYFRWLESKSYKMHVRVLLSRYRAYIPCSACGGKRFQPESLLYRVASSAGARVCDPQHVPRSIAPESSATHPTSEPAAGHRPALRPIPEAGLTLADFYQLPIRDALGFIEILAATLRPRPTDPLGLVLNEVRSRLGFMHDVGLGYLTLDRPTRSLSGGETERVNLTTCLGTRLVNTLFVLDEPSVGLHPRDTTRLVRILEQLRNAGNTVVVVEHEASVMRAADQIVDLGPGHGAAGGDLVYQGSYAGILKSRDSLTGKYLSGREQIPTPRRRKVKSRASASLTLGHANAHNLKDLTLEIPLGRLVVVTGVSGSGKTTLVREVLLPLLTSKLGSGNSEMPTPEVDPDAEETVLHDLPASNAPSLAGWQALGGAVLVDQSILAKTPRSNPAVYTGAFDDIRELFAASEIARQRGFNASAFSFNSGQGQCERCRGAGFEKIEMQFLSDVFIRCPECHGRRYRPHILEITISPEFAFSSHSAFRTPRSALESWSIGDFLESTVDDAIVFLSGFADSRHAKRALTALQLLQEVGLGYLKLGQPINTLSGGESQRLKLVRHLAESVPMNRDDRRKLPDNDVTEGHRPPLQPKPTLFLFDEPTTGLHFDDVRVLLKVFQRLVDAGHSVVIIEHNLDVIKSADWVIDLGPDAGDQGGEIVAQGTPEQITACARSHTGQALKEVLRVS